MLLALLAAGCASRPTEPPPAEPPAASLPADDRRTADLNTQLDAASRHCLALTLYWEARGEGRAGMQAVGAVVLNRVDDHRFPDTVCGVVKQGGETPPCQFSWWCDGRSDRPSNGRSWAAALALADEMLTARPRDPTRGALFFHSTSIDSPWRRTRTAHIGNHVFYR